MEYREKNYDKKNNLMKPNNPRTTFSVEQPLVYSRGDY